jgi:hypothetical protein
LLFDKNIQDGDCSGSRNWWQQLLQGAIREPLVCELNSDSEQDKEKPMAVRASNIMAARGMSFVLLIQEP